MGLSYIQGYYIESNYIHTTNKMPKGSGLTKPLNLSDELGDLIGAKKGEKLSRPEVVKRLWAYIKEKKLQDPENKQYFKPDKKMEPIRQGEDQSPRHGQVPQDPPDFIDDDATPGIISILALRPLSLSLSLPLCLSKSRRTRRVPEYCSSERPNSSTPRRPSMI